MPTATEIVVTTKPKPLVSYDINLPYTELAATKTSIKYPEYLPSWEKVWYAPLPNFKFDDPALRVKDKSKPHLLTDGVTVQDIQPRMGSVITGLQLNKLTDVQKDELALLVSERKVLAFPDQDLIDDGPAAQSEFMKYFGKLNYQPVSGTVKGYPGFHIIHRDGNKEEIAKFFEAKATSTLWHQDVSYEIQPPGYVMLGLLQGPDVGGDTVFAATDEAYK
jgi:sulfonate dioxygenase